MLLSEQTVTKGILNIDVPLTPVCYQSLASPRLSLDTQESLRGRQGKSRSQTTGMSRGQREGLGGKARIMSGTD